MGRSLILETTFLIDLDREERCGQPGPAVEFLEREPDARLYAPPRWWANWLRAPQRASATLEPF